MPQNGSGKQTAAPTLARGAQTPGGRTPVDLASLGLDSTVYLRVVTIAGTDAIAVHAADGARIAYADSADEAAAWVDREGLAVVSVH